MTHGPCLRAPTDYSSVFTGHYITVMAGDKDDVGTPHKVQWGQGGSNELCLVMDQISFTE